LDSACTLFSIPVMLPRTRSRGICFSRPFMKLSPRGESRSQMVRMASQISVKPPTTRNRLWPQRAVQVSSTNLAKQIWWASRASSSGIPTLIVQCVLYTSTIKQNLISFSRGSLRYLSLTSPVTTYVILSHLLFASIFSCKDKQLELCR
jgi:hypothetical protein